MLQLRLAVFREFIPHVSLWNIHATQGGNLRPFSWKSPNCFQTPISSFFFFPLPLCHTLQQINLLFLLLLAAGPPAPLSHSLLINVTRHCAPIITGFVSEINSCLPCDNDILAPSISPEPSGFSEPRKLPRWLTCVFVLTHLNVWVYISRFSMHIVLYSQIMSIWI